MIITIDGLAMKKKEDFYQNIKEELDVPVHTMVLDLSKKQNCILL